MKWGVNFTDIMLHNFIVLSCLFFFTSKRNSRLRLMVNGELLVSNSEVLCHWMVKYWPMDGKVLASGKLNSEDGAKRDRKFFWDSMLCRENSCLCFWWTSSLSVGGKHFCFRHVKWLFQTQYKRTNSVCALHYTFN